jgi:hypothetical protein
VFAGLLAARLESRRDITAWQVVSPLLVLCALLTLFPF